MTRRQSEIFLCLVLWIIAIILWIQMRDLRSSAQLFPMIILVIMSFLTGIVFVKNIISQIRKLNNNETTMKNKRVLVKVIALTIASIIYIYLIPIIGFYLMSALFLSFLYFGLGRTFRWQSLIKSVIGGIAVTLLIFFSFGYILNVRTPTGLFF